MRRRLTVLFAFGMITASAQNVTNNPRVEEASIDYVKITKVEVTMEHTAIYLRYVDSGRQSTQIPPNIPPQFRDFYRPQISKPEIWLDPNTRLYKPGDVNTKFRFLRAEGIPTNPERKIVEEGEVVEFVAYFEKVTPGIEIIDFYEGRSTQQTTAWNFYGIHIKNPDPKKQTVRTTTKEPVQGPAQTTAEADNSVVPVFSGLSGNVVNARTGEPMAATISYEENGDTVSLSTSSGKFRIALDPGKQYVFKATAQGFGDEVWHLDTASDSLNKGVFEHEFRLSPLTEGTTFTLDNIYFETSSFTLLSESFEELDQFVKILSDNPNISIRVEGHTDNIGNFDKNVKLSENRAEAVKNYLVEKGISPDRIETKGYGPTKPVAKGTSEEQRQKNRRVEIVILKS